MIYPILIPLINYHYIEKGSIIIITLFLFCMGVISAVIFQETKYKTFTMYSFFLTYTSLLLFIFYGIIALSPTSDIIKIIIIEIIALILLVLFIYLKRKKNAWTLINRPSGRIVAGFVETLDLLTGRDPRYPVVSSPRMGIPSHPTPRRGRTGTTKTICFVNQLHVRSIIFITSIVQEYFW